MNNNNKAPRVYFACQNNMRIAGHVVFLWGFYGVGRSRQSVSIYRCMSTNSVHRYFLFCFVLFLIYLSIFVIFLLSLFFIILFIFIFYFLLFLFFLTDTDFRNICFRMMMISLLFLYLFLLFYL